MADPTPTTVSAAWRWLALGACGLCVAAVALSVAAVMMIARVPEADTCACEADDDEPEAPPGAQVPDEPSGPSVAELGNVGQSLGAPWAGGLHRGKRLEPGPGYFVRNTRRAFGTDATVQHLQAAVDEVRRDLPKLHRLVIGDLSAEVGGALPGHFSHQSGRDVDIGLYYRELPPGFPRRFVPGTRDNLHFRGCMALLRALAKTADAASGIEWILLDYELQRMLHGWAKKHGYDEAELDRLFQFPHGPHSARGLVRHFPNHKNHLHVRFKCDPASTTCKPTPGGPKSALAENVDLVPAAHAGL